MKWKTRLGWALFTCGVLVALFFLIGLGHLIVDTLSENWSILLWIAGGGIAIFFGWQLAHSGKTRGLYSLSKEDTQGVVVFHATILRCIAERIEAKELRGKTTCDFDYGRTHHGMGCLQCEAFDPCKAIKKTLMRKLDQALRIRERVLEDSRSQA